MDREIFNKEKSKHLVSGKLVPFLILIVVLIFPLILSGQDRFPRPEFESGYEYHTVQMPAARNIVWEYIDTAVLLIVLSLTTWLTLKRRSRQGIILISVFTLAYFGFFREGCICAVGSIQNVSLALFNPGYTIPLAALLFFIIPLVFALAFGRVFCAGACPLGAIQELTGIKPVRVPAKVETVLSVIPFIYLAVAVLFSATDSQFLICRYDPFVGIFRLGGPNTMIIFGALLLLSGIFVNRPYCRYLCPYGVLLNIFSRFAGKHLTITPAGCTNCRLCEEVCPYDAIIPSDMIPTQEKSSVSRKRFIGYLVLIPVFAAAGAMAFYTISPYLAKINSDVMLANEIRTEKESGIIAVSKAAVAFKESGNTEDELFAQEEVVLGRFRKASPWAGLFLGLSLGIGLFSTTIRQERNEYRPHQGRCFSCGKCFKYCPVKAQN